MISLTLLSLVFHSLFAMQQHQHSYVSLQFSSTAPSDLSVLLPPLAGTPFTLDLSFRLNSAQSASFLILSFQNVGLEQSLTSLRPLNLPATCALTFTANTWYQISISITEIPELIYALNLVSVCTSAAALPESTLDSVKLILRPSGTYPSAITLSNLRYIKKSVSDLITSSALTSTRFFLSYATFSHTIYEVSFMTESVNSLRSMQYLSLAYQNLNQDITVAESTYQAPSTRSYLACPPAFNGLLSWNSNPRYTDQYEPLPTTL